MKTENPGLTVKFIAGGDPPKARRVGDHMRLVPPYQRLVCYHCGDWISPYPDSNSGVIPIKIFSAISKVFSAEHRRCEIRPEGRETFITLNREWDDFMEKHDAEREAWEDDHGEVWSRTLDWGGKYDAWIGLPFEKNRRGLPLPRL